MNKQNVKLDKKLYQSDEDLDEVAKKLLNIMEKGKQNKKDRKSEIFIDDDGLLDENNENDLNNGGEMKDDDEDDNDYDENADDEDEDEEYETTNDDNVDEDEERKIFENKSTT